MTIDAKTAEGLALWAHAQAAQIRSAATSMSPDRDTADRLEGLGNLASAYAATLPREVERECWEVVDSDGVCHGYYMIQSVARRICSLGSGRHVVRLTGKAILPRVKD